MGSIRSFFRRHRRRRRLEQEQSQPQPPASPSSEEQRTSMEELQRVFGKFDANGDGRISAAELASVVESLSGHPPSPEEVAGMMAEADADGDGFISLAEFVDLNTAGLGPTDELEDLRHAFSVFDLDRSGSISADELARVLRGLGEPASVAQCRRMIDGVDRDGDGLISFEEFRVMMTAGPSGGFSAAALPVAVTKIDE